MAKPPLREAEPSKNKERDSVRAFRGQVSPSLVGDAAAVWNPRAALTSLESLMRKMPDLTAPVVTRDREPVPRTARQIKGDRAKALILAYREGATVYELADRFGITRQTASRVLKRHNIPIRVTARGHQLTEEEIDEGVRLYAQGQSLARIADQLSVSDNTVRHRLLERGVKLRDSHGRERS